MKKNYLKKYVCYLFLIILTTPLCISEEWTSGLFGLSAMEKLTYDYRVGINSIERLKYGWLPSIDINGDYKMYGGVGDVMSCLTGDLTLGLKQKLPFGGAVWAQMDIPFTAFYPQTQDQSFSGEFVSSLGLNLPVTYDCSLLRSYFSVLKNEYVIEKKCLDLDYKIEFRALIEEYCGAVWDYLYYGRLIKLLLEEDSLYCQLEKDYETLLEKGKITVVQFYEQNAKHRDLKNDIIQVRSCFCTSRKKLALLGIEEEDLNLDSGEFLAWLKVFCARFDEVLGYKIEYEKAQLTKSYYYSIKNRFEKVPVLQTTFSVNKNMNWNLGLSIGVEVFPSLLCDSNRKSGTFEKKAYELKMNELERVQKRICDEQALEKESALVNFESMIQEVEEGRTRLESYEHLLEIGRIPSLGVLMEKNRLAQTELKRDDGEYRLYRAILSFY